LPGDENAYHTDGPDVVQLDDGSSPSTDASTVVPDTAAGRARGVALPRASFGGGAAVAGVAARSQIARTGPMVHNRLTCLMTASWLTATPNLVRSR
jgi:hypothetical protein